MSCTYPDETNEGRVTSYVPLSTTFSSVLLCSNSFMLEGDRLVAFDPDLGVTIAPGVSCQPQQVTTWWEQALVAQNTAYSLGPLVCPQSWPTVATYAKNSASTQAMCCPPGYTLENGQSGTVGGDCISNIPSGATLTYQSTGTDSTSWTLATTTLDSASTVGAIAVVGWNINDISACETSTTSSKTAAASYPPARTTPTNTASAPAQTTSALTANGLSTGAKAGLGVGVALAAVGLAALIGAILIVRRRKRTAADKTTNSPPGSFHTDPTNRLYGQKPAELHHQSLEKPLQQPGLYYQSVEVPPTELDAAGSPRP